MRTHYLIYIKNKHFLKTKEHKSIIEQYIVAIFAMSKDKGNLIKDNVRYLVKVKSIQENGIS